MQNPYPYMEERYQISVYGYGIGWLKTWNFKMAITFHVGIIGRRNFGIVISIMDTFDISNKQKMHFVW